MPTDGKINIYITEGDLPDELGQGKGGQGGQKPSKSQSDMFKTYLKHEMLHMVRNTVHNMVNFSVNQIGNMRGDYAMQRDVENALTIGRQVMGVGAAALVGSKFGVPGAIVGAGVAIVSNTINGLINIHNESIKYKKQNYEIAQLRTRTGMNTLLDGSRGTLE